MKNKPIHYGACMRTPCGRCSIDVEMTTTEWDKVTCKLCLRNEKAKIWGEKIRVHTDFINRIGSTHLVGGTEEYEE